MSPNYITMKPCGYEVVQAIEIVKVEVICCSRAAGQALGPVWSWAKCTG